MLKSVQIIQSPSVTFPQVPQEPQGLEETLQVTSRSSVYYLILEILL